jgi:hypothetical protein
MGENTNAYRILVGKQKERDHWEDQDEDRMVWACGGLL